MKFQRTQKNRIAINSISLALITILLLSSILPLYSSDSAIIEINDKTPKIAILDITKRNSATSPDTGNYYAVIHAVKIMGIPYIITEDLTIAFNEKIVIINDRIKSSTFTNSEISAIKNYVQNGGIVLSAFSISDAFNSLMGVNYKTSANTRHTITFDMTKNDTIFRYINQDNEKTISLGKAKYTTIFSTATYEVLTAVVLAKFEDGKPAISVNHYGNGKFYTFATQWKDIILKPEINKDYEAQRTYSNGFEPGKDVFLLIIKALYETLPFAILKHTVLNGEETALILTHDVDTNVSFKNSIDFMNLEKNYGVKSTFFITTKYFIDARDKALFYNADNIPYLKILKENEFDVQSHTVGHFPDFSKFPLGDINVVKETYNPYNDGTITTGGTIYGEVKVSKQLLDSDLTQNTISFRAGHLSFPSKLPTALQNSGYRYDSSFSANDVLTNYPYTLMKEMYSTSSESSVIEIPMTISDSWKSLMLDSTNVDYVVNDVWIKVAEENRENNAITVLLIHPSVLSYKISAETKLLDFVKDKNYWTGDLTTFGNFWKQRDELSYVSEVKDGILYIKLNKNYDELLSGMTLEIVNSSNVSNFVIKSKDNKDISFNQIVEHTNFGDKIFIVLKVDSGFEERNTSENIAVERR